MADLSTLLQAALAMVNQVATYSISPERQKQAEKVRRHPTGDSRNCSLLLPAVAVSPVQRQHKGSGLSSLQAIFLSLAVCNERGALDVGSPGFCKADRTEGAQRLCERGQLHRNTPAIGGCFPLAPP